MIAPLIYLNQMETDINYPKSKAFNVFLRFLQLSLSLACSVFLIELVERSCRDEQFRTLEILVAALTAVSILALIVVKCSVGHPKLGFVLLFVLAAGAVVTIGFLSFMDLKTSTCGFTEQLYVYYIAQCALYLLVILLVLLLPLLWIQRFTNSPGNLVWPGLFLYFMQWQGTFYMIMLYIAGLTVLVSILTFIANIFAGFKGTTTGIKKFIKFAWLFDLILMLIAQGLAVYAFTLGRSNGHFQSGFSGSKAKMLLQCFILVNLIDLIFWLYGYQSLDYQNGDAIRDQLVKFGKNPQFQEESDVQEYGKGQYGQLQ